ncbi:hypothetical protein Pint_14391 [Pistacia integerrima]|uniref:Uncharacterized protein n=1 Tax=Pistacia integerrima TaxID=434235 RepID=A0ACC0Y6H1_9ROSI|nr:hypothetical protein Pint_14391 [Pistacia integerrima]
MPASSTTNPCQHPLREMLDFLHKAGRYALVGSQVYNEPELMITPLSTQVLWNIFSSISSILSPYTNTIKRNERLSSLRNIETYQRIRDGNTTVELDRWGNYYFISGAEGHCEKGQKLEIYAEVDGVCYWRTREFPTPPEAIADEEEEDHDGDKKDYYIYESF